MIFTLGSHHDLPEASLCGECFGGSSKPQGETEMIHAAAKLVYRSIADH